MPKKGKGKGKGKKGEEKKAKKKNWLSEKDTVSYEQQITDNNKQLARLRSRNTELEIENEELAKKLETLTEDRSDVIAHLKRLLQEKTDHAHELSERYQGLDELRKDENVAFKKTEETLQSEYQTMHMNLTAEVKLVGGKLNALEEWRMARTELMRKFEVQEEQMTKQREEHEQKLYEVEKSLIQNKAKLQMEVEERLKGLAKSFKEATAIRMAEVIERAVKENVALNREMDIMFKLCDDLERSAKEYREKDENSRLMCELYQSEARLVLNKTIKQNNLIDKLAREHFDLKVNYGKLRRADDYSAKMREYAQFYVYESSENKRKIRILEQNIQRNNEEQEMLIELINKNCQQIRQFDSIINEAKDVLLSALKLQKEVPSDDDVCTCCFPQVKEDLLYTLFKILSQPNKESSELSIKEHMKLIKTIKHTYKSGNLGLIPETPDKTFEEEFESSWKSQESEDYTRVKLSSKSSSDSFDYGEAIVESPKIKSCFIDSNDSSSAVESPRELSESEDEVLVQREEIVVAVAAVEEEQLND